jgi:hypothetical protein
MWFKAERDKAILQKELEHEKEGQPQYNGYDFQHTIFNFVLMNLHVE